ncbi:MAG: hypothetical protein E7388_03890 [Ruminococcaceae bacterium]|nr:hypothetical protein [Oscillospiraceae bacterium]
MYLIADFFVNFQNKYSFIDELCIEYKCKDNTPADFLISVSDEELQQEHLRSSVKYSNGYVESVCAYRKLALELPLRDAFLLHGSVISCQGKGVAFLARSGVGKTTHTLLWKKVYGDNVTVINGDKPIIRYVDEVPFAYGTPWAGKENLSVNEKVRLTDICILQRSEKNFIRKVDKSEIVDFFMAQVLLPGKSETLIKALELYDRVLEDCNIWCIGCNMDDEAAVVAHDGILGGKA